jgi:hypothetical protein
MKGRTQEDQEDDEQEEEEGARWNAGSVEER